MNYNTGASHLLTAIVQRVSGMTAAAFAEQHLFQPLGIVEYTWRQDPQGMNDGGSGLALTADAMARFGLLYLNGGRWEDHQVLSADWVSASTTAQYVTYPYIVHYTRHWWVIPPTGTSPGYYFALGYGGQFILIVPDRAAVVAITSELYAQSLLPMELFRQYLLPALSSASM
jgi:CubicO group peptidase (beta-lactamase class C family)